MILKDRIKKIREDVNMSQAEFSKEILVGSSTVAMWELGTRKPKDIHISKICEKWNINEEWLRTGKGKMKKELSIEEMTYGRFGKIMETGNPIRKNVVTMLLALAEKLTNEQWEDIYVEIKDSIARIEKEKGDED